MEAPTLTQNQQASLQRVQVRPILPTEQERWNTLVRAHHYRGFRTLVGRTLRYVATLNDRWVALGWLNRRLSVSGAGAVDRLVWGLAPPAPASHCQ